MQLSRESDGPATQSKLAEAHLLKPTAVLELLASINLPWLERAAEGGRERRLPAWLDRKIFIPSKISHLNPFFFLLF
jgi:hypothetical protein